jgi:flavodoxin
MNALVAFYSRTGTTKKVAEELSSLLKCASEEIRDTKNRKGILGWLSAGRDATTERLTELEPLNYDPASYELVIIGTPMWNHRMSVATRTYLTQYKNSFRSVAFFCTHQFTDHCPFVEMESLSGKMPVATLKLHRKKDVKSGLYINKLREFVDKLDS